MRFLQDNWGEIIWYGLILFLVSSCVKGNIDERASKRAIKEQKRIENKIEEERRIIESKPFIETFHSKKPKNFDDFSSKIDRYPPYTIDIEDFFLLSGDELFIGSFELEDVHRLSGKQIMVLSSTNFLFSLDFDFRPTVFNIACEMDVSDIDYRDEVVIIFSVHKVSSSSYGINQSSDDVPSIDFPLTRVDGNCLASVQNFRGLDKLLNHTDETT